MVFSRHDFPAKILCLAGFFCWLGILSYKYYNLGYYDWDLAFFAQAMWGLSHGSGYVSLFDMRFLANHANLIAYLLVPLYKILPSVFTLLVLKLVSFFTASYVLYLLAKEKLGERLALLVLWFYLVYPANIFGLQYEFDFENFALVFLMFMIYFYVHEKWTAFMINSIVLILIKENMPLIVMAFGIYGFLTKPDKLRWGLVPFILGGLSFYLLAFVLVPLMGNHAVGQHPYMAHYALFFKQPGQAISSIFTTDSFGWFEQLFCPLLCLPLLALGALLPIAPIILQHLLSASWQEHTVYFAYAMTLAPFIFWAFIHALGRLKEKLSKTMFYCIFLLIVLSSSVYLWGNIGEIKFRYMNLNSVKEAPYRWQLLKMVPPQAAVVATFNFLPELSQRPYLYAFHRIYDPAYQNGQEFYQLPGHVQYALIDFNDPWYQGDLQNNYGFTKQRVQAFLALGWVPVKSFDNTVLFKRKD